MRNLATLLAASGDEPLPLAKDGRVDVYRFVHCGEISGPDDLEVYVSGLRGGPTLEEILADDYTNFAYERFRGSVSGNGTGNVPLLWDREPRNGLCIVGLNGGRVAFMEEAELQVLLREHGQVESDGTQR